jgi:DNA-binding FadR family transcriptional regulator
VTRLAPTQIVFRPVRGSNTFEETVERLLQAVKLGQFGPGDKLPTERALSAQLEVSRVTLREAIRVLALAGYLDSRRGRGGGTFVLAPTEWRRDSRDAGTIARDMGSELTDALLLRDVLEPGAVRLAARRSHSEDAIADLQAALAAEQAAEIADYRPADSRLHLALAALAGSVTLSAAVADARMRLNDLLDAIPLLPPNIEHSKAQHRRIVTAVLRGRPEAARLAMEEHLEGTAALLRGFLD